MAAHRAGVRPGPPSAPPAPRVRFADVLRNRTFAVLFAAEMQSIAGDQIARVALSVLAFDRTHSALAAAGTYAATMVPVVLGGLFLSGLADRLPRRAVMVAVALVSAGCFALMSVPGIPLGVIIALLVVAVALGPLFSSAELSHLSLTLDTEEYRVGTAARLMSSQGAQVAGFAIGGLLVALAGARMSLLADAITFGFAALLIATLLPAAATRPVAQERPDARSPDSTAPEPFAGLWRTPRLRLLLLLGGLIGLFVVPEGLAVPFGRSVGASTTEIGLLLGAAALGGALGAVIVARAIAPEHRMASARVMAALCGLPLVASGLVGHWPVAATCWLLSGVFAAYIVEVTSTLIQSVPAGRRAHFVGIVNTVLLVSQGVGMLAFGAVSNASTPGAAIAAAGAVGSGLALVLPLAVLGTRSHRGRRGGHRIDEMRQPEAA